MGAGRELPGVWGRVREQLSAEAGGSRAGTPRGARSLNSPNWGANLQIRSSESPPPAHAPARATGGVRRGPGGWEPGGGRVPASGGGTAPPPRPGPARHPLLLQDARGAFPAGARGYRGAAGGVLAVLLNPFRRPRFPSPPPPVSNSGPLNLITFPDIGWCLGHPRDKRVEVGKRVRVRACAWGGAAVAARPGRFQRKLRGRHKPGKESEGGGGGAGCGVGAPALLHWKSPHEAPQPRTCAPSAPAPPYRGRSNHGIRVTVSRDVDMKRKVVASSVIQSVPHPAAATPQQGGKRQETGTGRSSRAGPCRGAARGAARRARRLHSEPREHNLRGYNQPTRPDGCALSALTPCAPSRPPPRPVRAGSRACSARPSALVLGAGTGAGSFLLPLFKENTQTTRTSSLLQSPR